MASDDDLRRRVDDLTERVNALEATPPAEATTPTEQHTPLPPDTFWALTELQRRRPEDSATDDGAVMIVGSLDLPTGEQIAWQEAGGTTDLLDVDWGDLADCLAALGHPVRLELLRRILGGTRSTADLATSAGLGTTGQLHHHLRQLKSAGWIQQTGRGTYEVPARRIVPLLTTVLGAHR